jgi:hypothetical protein
LHLIFVFSLWLLFLVGVDELYLSEGSSVAHIGTREGAILIMLGVQSFRGEVGEWESVQFDCVAVLGTEGPLLLFLWREVGVLQGAVPQG